jgi:DNA-binding NarL/FixJ family response regulator
MAIEGPLQDIGIHDVFQLLDLARKSGRLTVRSSVRENEGRVYFDKGAVVHATMRDNPHTLGALLRKAGKVSERELAAATEAQAAGDERMLGEILVAQGAVTRRDVERYIRQQIESVVFDLFSWNEGTFSFADGSGDAVRIDGAIRVSIESLLMEGARRIDEWSRMKDRIPGADVVPRLAQPRMTSNEYIDLRPAEWEVLTLVDGTHSLRDIAAELAVSEFEVAKTVYGMLSTELIEIATQRSEAAA